MQKIVYAQRVADEKEEEIQGDIFDFQVSTISPLCLHGRPLSKQRATSNDSITIRGSGNNPA